MWLLKKTTGLLTWRQEDAAQKAGFGTPSSKRRTYNQTKARRLCVLQKNAGPTAGPRRNQCRPARGRARILHFILLARVSKRQKKLGLAPRVRSEEPKPDKSAPVTPCPANAGPSTGNQFAINLPLSRGCPPLRLVHPRK